MLGRFSLILGTVILSGCAFLQKVKPCDVCVIAPETEACKQAVLTGLCSVPPVTPPVTPPVVPPVVPPGEPEKPPEPSPVVVEPPVLHLYCPSSGGEYELLSRVPSPHSKVINEVMEEVSGCAPSSDCTIGKTPEESTVFRGKVVAELAKRGICAWLQEEKDDAPIAVGTIEENFTHHIVNFGGFKVRWQPSANEPPDRWRLVKPLEPVKNCPELGRLDYGVKQFAQRSLDITPKTLGLEVCTSLGFLNRRECPFGVDIEGQYNPEKIRCEAFYGPYACTVNGAECPRFNKNPLQWNAAASGTYRICSRTQVCVEVVLP